MPTEQYPSIIRSILGSKTRDPQKRVAAFEREVQELSQYVANGAIPNPKYADLKRSLSRVIEQAYDSEIHDRFVLGKSNQLTDAERDVFTYVSAPAPHTIASWKKKLAKLPQNDMVTATNAFIAEIEPICNLLIAAKNLVVKRQAKSTEENPRAKYVAPEASKSGMKKVHDLLMSISDQARDNLIRYFQDRYQRMLDAYLVTQSDLIEKSKSPDQKIARDANSPYAIYRGRDARRINMEAYEIVSALTEKKYDFDLRRDVYAPKPEAAERIIERATKVADEIREAFVNKNLMKLDSIVERKDNLETAEVIGQSISMQGLEGSLRFVFADGSSFVCRNTVVFAYSVHGTPFYRFPLTFHNVVLPTGEKMKQPSEEKMNLQFL